MCIGIELPINRDPLPPPKKNNNNNNKGTHITTSYCKYSDKSMYSPHPVDQLINK